MSYSDQASFDIRCEWGQQAIEQLAPSDVVIIVDVLSFSTCVDVAVGRGVVVLPYRWHDDSAAAYAASHKAELASGRSRFAGKYSLSPSSLLEARSGLRLVLPSPNGSALAFQAAHSGAKVIAGCLRNAAAVAANARIHAKTVTVVPAGERWYDGSLRVAVEDWWGAGAIIAGLTGNRSPEAEAAVAAYAAVADKLLSSLESCASGRELMERHFERDVALAAQLNVSTVTPVLEGDEFVAVAG
jgi:2-phosphosulfolactate phosphatase